MRLKALLIIAVMIGLCLGANFLYNLKHEEQITNSYTKPLKKAVKQDNPTESIDPETFAVNDKFETSLPLVILDLPEGEPPIYMRKTETGDYALIEGVEQYVDGQFILINTGGINRPTDEPEVSTEMTIKRRGNSSMMYEKAQWSIKFLTEFGQFRDIDILGMGEEHEWILNGSLADKSMLRNYLAYSIASEFMPYVPEEEFCEVLIRENGQLRYQGIYLLGENIKHGSDRINLEKFNSNRVANSYIIRRDRFDEEGIMLDTYGRLNGYNKKYIGVIYPSKNDITPDVFHYIEDDVNSIEEILYSKEDKVFYTYPEVIDVNSFVDYFLLNEFFLSYDAGENSTYAYKEFGGKLSMGPVWDFDGTMDNYVIEPAEPKNLAFEVKPWFDMLCTDKVFVQKLIDRYAELRNTSFSDQHINEKIIEITEHLGGAKDREWLRWGSWYTSVSTAPPIGLQDYRREDGVILHRNATNLDDELYRIKTVLHDHAEAMPTALIALRDTATRNSGLGRWKTWLLFGALCIFVIPSILIVYSKK